LHHRPTEFNKADKALRICGLLVTTKNAATSYFFTHNKQRPMILVSEFSQYEYSRQGAQCQINVNKQQTEIASELTS